MKAFVAGCLLVLGLLCRPAVADVMNPNLTGHYICVKNCQGMVGYSAYVTQNGWDLNLLTPRNEPLRASTDWFSPNRLWVGTWNTGAVYSPDGRIIQFDNGMIWGKCVYYRRHCHWHA